MTAIIALLLRESAIPGVSTPLVGTVALWVAAILTLGSMDHYLWLAAPHFVESPITRNGGSTQAGRTVDPRAP